MIGLKVDNQEKWESIEDKPLYCLQCCQIKKLPFCKYVAQGTLGVQIKTLNNIANNFVVGNTVQHQANRVRHLNKVI